MTQSQIIFLVMAPLIVWRFYSRYRKLVGKQRVRPVRLWMSVILFPLLFVMIGAVSSSNTNALMCLVAGGIAGVALSFLGLRLTRFDVQDDGLHYTPNAYIGMALMMVLVGRLAYRYALMWGGATQAGTNPAQSLTNSPLTLFSSACCSATMRRILRASCGIMRKSRPRRSRSKQEASRRRRKPAIEELSRQR